MTIRRSANSSRFRELRSARPLLTVIALALAGCYTKLLPPPPRTVMRNRQTEPACGVRLRLLGMQTDGPLFRATFELTRDPATPKP